jgi:hypothetical protein
MVRFAVLKPVTGDQRQHRSNKLIPVICIEEKVIATLIDYIILFAYSSHLE